MTPVNPYMVPTLHFKIKRGQGMATPITNTAGPDDLPIDWTGKTFRCQIRKSESRTSPLIATITVTCPDPASGIYYLNLSSDISSLIEEGTYEYDVFCMTGDPTQDRFVLMGQFIVEGRVTR